MVKLRFRKSYLDNIIFTYLFFVIFSFNESNEFVWLIYVGFLGVATLSLLQILNHHGKIVIPCITLLLIFFYVWCLIGALANANIISSIVSRVFTLVLLFAVMLLMYNYLYYTRNLDNILVCMYVAGVIFAIYVVFAEGGLATYVQGILVGRRMGASIANVNSIGLNLCFSYASGCYFFCQKKKISILIPLVPIFFVAAGTGSRKVMLFLIGFSALFVFFYIQLTTKKHSISRFKKFCGIALLAIATVLFIASTGIFDTTIERFSSMFDVSRTGQIRDGSANERANMIKIGLISFTDKPFWGYGLTGSGIITQRYLGWNTYLHNNYVEILASSGIIGFILYYGFYAYLLIKMLLRLKEKSMIIVFGFSTLFIQLVLEVAVVSYYSKRLAIFNAIWLFIVLKSDKRENIVMRVDAESSDIPINGEAISE